MRFNLTGKRWLKMGHIFMAGLWIAGAVALLMMQTMLTAGSDGEHYGIDRALKFIDDFIIIPGAMGCLLTGILYAVFTPWRFFRHRWIVIKWIITIIGIIFGTFWLGAWMNAQPPLSLELGLAALDNQEYVSYRQMNLYGGMIQLGTLLFALYLSVFKPFAKKQRI